MVSLPTFLVGRKIYPAEICYALSKILRVISQLKTAVINTAILLLYYQSFQCQGWNTGEN